MQAMHDFHICFGVDSESNSDELAAWLARHIDLHCAIAELRPFHFDETGWKIDGMPPKTSAELNCTGR